jgi:CRISPR-associated protein Csx17
VARGVASFVRFGFLKRNGLAYLATPLGRFAVVPHPKVHLLDDPALTEWLDALRLACRDKDRTPARYLTALRNIDKAVFAYATRSQIDDAGEKPGLLNILIALGKAERTLATGPGFRKKHGLRPLQGLGPAWITDCDEESPEFRLAAALASIRRVPDTEIGTLREYLEPVKPRGPSLHWNDASRSAVWSNRSLAQNLAAVFLRRLLECERLRVKIKDKGLALSATRSAPRQDVAAFLEGTTDDNRLVDLLWALVAVDWSKVEYAAPASAHTSLSREFGLLRLVVHPVRLAVEQQDRASLWTCPPKKQPATSRTTPDRFAFRLLASRGPNAVQAAVGRTERRLWADGLPPFGWRHRTHGMLAVQTTLDPVRLLAALLFPLSRRSLAVLANRVLFPPADHP